MTHTLPNMPYEYNALEPFIDEQTMRIHHTKHHQTYVDKLNAALEKHPEWKGKSVDELLKSLPKIQDDIRTAVRNHGGGHWNHSFFWPILKKDVKIGGKVADAISKKFGSFDAFKEAFANAAANHFGSGWAWLVVNKGQLEITSTPNQDSPVADGKIPVLGIDVWEHAYYILYQNRRADYIQAFFNVINWKKVDELYQKAVK